MRLLILIAFHLHTTKVFCRKYSSSEESIENLLYYKDCNHRTKATTAAPQPLRIEQPPQPECPFPKMCCSMSCGNECGGPQSSLLGRQMSPMQNLQPIQSMPRQPVQPQILQRGRMKKTNKNVQIPPNMFDKAKMLPIIGRRDFGFTKDKIKSLISQDDDIRKILKDLVRVTMQKVDLLQLINNRKAVTPKTADGSLNNSEEDFNNPEA